MSKINVKYKRIISVSDIMIDNISGVGIARSKDLFFLLPLLAATGSASPAQMPSLLIETGKK